MNLCVHDVRNFKFSIDKHLAGLSNEKRNELMKPILKILKPEVRNKLSPQWALFTGTMNVMFQLYLHHMKCENRFLHAKLDLLQSKTSALNPLPRKSRIAASKL